VQPDLTREALRRRDERELLAWLEPVCQGVVTPFFLPGGEREDLLQEARIAALDAIRRFRGEHPVLFVSFAHLVIRRRVITVVIGANRGLRRLLNEAVSLHVPNGSAEDASTAPGAVATLADVIELRQPTAGELIEERDRVRAAVRDIACRLSELEREAIVGVVFEGRAYEDIGQHKRVDNAVQRARRKLAGWDEARAA
jgi:RNA polymerase sporulation-specific sigma factor